MAVPRERYQEKLDEIHGIQKPHLRVVDGGKSNHPEIAELEEKLSQHTREENIEAIQKAINQNKFNRIKLEEEAKEKAMAELEKNQQELNELGNKLSQAPKLKDIIKIPPKIERKTMTPSVEELIKKIQPKETEKEDYAYAQMNQKEMDIIGKSAELYDKLGREEKTIIDLFSKEKNSIAGAERARDYMENTEYITTAKQKSVELLLNYLKNDRNIYKNLIIEINSMLPEEMLELEIAESNFNRENQEYENFVQATDEEDKMIKKLNKKQKLDLETLVELRRANDKDQIIFNNYLNGLNFDEQNKILPILKSRLDTKSWIESWQKTQNGRQYETLSKTVPQKKGIWEKIKSIFGK